MSARHRLGYGSTIGLVLMACGGCKPCAEEPRGPQPPCGLNEATQLADEQKLVNNLGLFTAPPDASGDTLLGHCKTVWNEAVEVRHCGKESIPAFCESCQTPTDKEYCLRGNGRGQVMQHCRETTIDVFRKHYTACAGVALCVGDLQLETAKCEAGKR